MEQAGGLAPTAAGERIDTLDVLRGVAICGILLMNIPGMGGIGEIHAPRSPAGWNADWISWGLQSTLFEGTMRGLFSMLFGAGMLLMLRRSEGPGAVVTPIDVWTRRCLALMALGVVQAAVFLWPGEILWTYGLSGLALLAFRTARPKTLGIAAALMLVALSGWHLHEARQHVALMERGVAATARQAAGRPLDKAQRTAAEALEEARKAADPTPAQFAAEVAQRTHLATVIGWSTGEWATYNLGSDAWPWLVESIAFMLIGMMLYRLRILTGEATPALYRRLMAVGYGGGIALRLVGLLLFSRAGFVFDPARPDAPWALWRGGSYEAARLLVTLGHVGLLASLYRSGAIGRAVTLRSLGRMALTVYSLQSILTSILFYGLGYVGMFGFAQLMLTAVAIWIMTALFSRWWLARHAMGPAERVLRAIAYNSFNRRRGEAAATLATAPPI